MPANDTRQVDELVQDAKHICDVDAAGGAKHIEDEGLREAAAGGFRDGARKSKLVGCTADLFWAEVA